MRTWMVLLLVWTTAATAGGVYKWVDDQGRVHYGEQPPSGGQAQQMQVQQAPPAAEAPDDATRQERQQKLLRAFDEERAQKTEEEQKQREAAVRKERNCAIARDRLTSMNQAGYIYDLDDKGERRVYSDAERAAAEQKARADVDRWCQ